MGSFSINWGRLYFSTHSFKKVCKSIVISNLFLILRLKETIKN
jgi:hypothetical protein